MKWNILKYSGLMEWYVGMSYIINADTDCVSLVLICI
jgi:hypothetical protein